MFRLYRLRVTRRDCKQNNMNNTELQMLSKILCNSGLKMIHICELIPITHT